MNIKELIKQAPYNLNDVQVEWVYEMLGEMSTEDKIHHMFSSIAYSDDEGYLSMIMNDGFGGLMCRPMPGEQVANLTRILQDNSKIPMLISGNMESGMETCCLTGTKVGAQMAIAATDDVHYAKELGRIIGEEANALGMNWAFAPVVDIDMNWRNPITNIRTYGADAKRVAKMGAAYVTELQKHGVAASVKHFPGDGVDERDQHLLTSINSLSADEWMETYGHVYKSCIDAGALTVMAGYIMQPAWSRKLNPNLKDEDILPGALSAELLQGLLRDKLGFNGTIITDSTSMAGLGSAMARRDAIPQCINAGCDMILFAKNTQEDFMFVRNAIESGVISMERIDEANIRILALKAALKLPEKMKDGSIKGDMNKINTVVGCDEHLAVSKEVADKSITIVKEEKGVLPLSTDKYKKILLYPKEQGTEEFGPETRIGAVAERLRKEGFAVDIFKPSPGFEGVVAPMSDIEDNYDLIVYVANQGTKSNQTVIRLEWLDPMGIDCPIYIHQMPNIFISLENPYHLVDVPRIRTYINTYGSTDIVLDMLIDKLMGRSEFKGQSPVDAFCGMWDTRL